MDENSNLDALNLSFKYIIIPGRQDGCGSWLLEDKKLICGMEEKTVLANGRLALKIIFVILLNTVSN